MFTTDNHFLIGSMHVTAGKPCQDHALSGSDDDYAFAVVSDGCSSGGMTDVGARFMTLSLANAFRSIRDVDHEEIEEHQWRQVRDAQASFGLARDDLIATCLYACASPGGAVVRVMGDGAVAVVRKDGSIELHRFEWQNNTPFYPIYLYDGIAAFLEAHGEDPGAFTKHSATAFGIGPWQQGPVEQFDAREGIKGYTLEYSADELGTIAYLAVFSDGVFQVEGVDWEDAVCSLLAFKSCEGAFAKRRMIRFVQDARKNGKGPFDDIAYAVIRIANETKGDDS